ncbi:unnamed protein product [Sphagnum troendelagicum]|uniref:Protein kinase domain-containing protein n=1 Tax=Sphagnum troendelagicum TaxID=128251 RepID=A0ABP0U2M9_9BRYO
MKGVAQCSDAAAAAACGGASRRIMRVWQVGFVLFLFFCCCCYPCGEAAAVAVASSSSGIWRSRYQTTASDALLAFKKGVGDPNVLRSWEGNPCFSVWRGIRCSGDNKGNFHVTSLKLSNLRLRGWIAPELGNLTGLVNLWLDNNQLTGYIPASFNALKNLTSLRLANNRLVGGIPWSISALPKLRELSLENNQLSGAIPFNISAFKAVNIRIEGNAQLCSPTLSQNLSGCVLPPTLVIGPIPAVSGPTGRDRSLIGAIAGGVTGAVVLVGTTVALVSLCLLRAKSSHADGSDSGSSEPSAVDERSGGILTVIAETQQARQFTLDELDHATKRFNPSNKIGEGGFGPVYKGLLNDGTIVAIKRRTGGPRIEFAEEVERLAQIRHRHLVNVLGFCQESELQILVFDYLPNGSICNHLYDANGKGLGKLDFKQRLSIALGAAKGLECLHSRGFVHKDFKTSNVLLDENLVPKVTDFGLACLLGDGPDMVLSSTPNGTNGFLDPEFNTLQALTEKSDVYSYGVFLLELVSGREAVNFNSPEPERNLVEWGRVLLHTGNLAAFVDVTLGDNFTEEAMQRLVEIGFNCVDISGEGRPSIVEVTKDVEEILEKERGLVAGPSHGHTTVTLGSELFA